MNRSRVSVNHGGALRIAGSAADAVWGDGMETIQASCQQARSKYPGFIVVAEYAGGVVAFDEDAATLELCLNQAHYERYANAVFCAENEHAILSLVDRMYRVAVIPEEFSNFFCA